MSKIDRLLMGSLAAGLWALAFAVVFSPDIAQSQYGGSRVQSLQPHQVRTEVKAVLNRCKVTGHVSERGFSNLAASLSC